MISPKFLIACGIAASLVFLGAVFFWSGAPPRNGGFAGADFSGQAGVSGIPANAFLPKIPDGAPPFAGESGVAAMPSASAKFPEFRVQAPVFDGIKNLFSASYGPPQPARKELLELPDVPEDAISLDKSGSSNVLDYLRYFVTHSAQIDFSNEDYKSFPKDENGLPLSITGFVDKVLAGNSPEKDETGGAVLKRYISKKIVYEKSIKVSGGAIPLDREMIAIDEASLSLIDKVFSAKGGGMPQKDFDDYYSKYKNTAISIHSKLVPEVQSLALGGSGNIFWRLAGAFGLNKIAFAAAPLLVGGPVLVEIPCTCPPFGVEVIVGPPRAGPFYLTLTFMASPLFFPFKQSHVGSFQLGIATLPPLACNAFPVCAIAAAPIILDGTSE